MLKKNLVAFGTFILFATSVSAQDKFYTKTGTVKFYSKAAMEDIEATNKTAAAVLDSKTGALQFAVQMKGFEFEKQLMQQHFNDKYVESNTYPKAEFKGSFTNNSAVNYTKPGSYKATVKGKLTLHGVTKDVEAPATIKVEGGNLNATSSFTILLSDYKVAIPSMSKDKISNTITISVDTKLEPLKS